MLLDAYFRCGRYMDGGIEFKDSAFLFHRSDNFKSDSSLFSSNFLRSCFYRDRENASLQHTRRFILRKEIVADADQNE